MCIKDSAGYDGQRSKINVDYLVIGGNEGNGFYLHRIIAELTITQLVLSETVYQQHVYSASGGEVIIQPCCTCSFAFNMLSLI